MRAPACCAILVGLVLVGCSGQSDSGRATSSRPRPKSESTTAPPAETAPAARPEDAPEGPYWPRFHGPDGSNLSPETGLLKEWPEGGPPLVWTAEGIGHGFSTVSLAGGMIFTDGNVGSDTTITALDLAGNTLWQKPNGPAWTGSHPGSRGTPTYDSGRIYHESPLGSLVCLEAKTGALVWGLNILSEFGAENIQWALAESVLIDGDHVICCPGGTQGSVVALDKRSGETVWAAPGTGHAASYASPMLAEQDGLRMVLTMNAKSLLGVNADTGELLFEFPHETSYDVNAFSPLYHDGHIFISTGYGSGSVLVKVTVDGKKARVAQVWESKELDNHHGGVLLLGNYLYGSTFRGKWVCLDWQSGQTQYAQSGVGKGSLTYADGMLYCFSEKRRVGLVKATPEAHEVVSQFTLPSGGKGSSWAHPVVIGGRLYLRHSDKLFAYDVSAR